MMSVWRALKTARRVIAAERRDQLSSCTIFPHRGPQMRPPYPGMTDDERTAIRRFDRALAEIDEALRVYP